MFPQVVPRLGEAHQLPHSDPGTRCPWFSRGTAGQMVLPALTGLCRLRSRVTVPPARGPGREVPPVASGCQRSALRSSQVLSSHPILVFSPFWLSLPAGQLVSKMPFLLIILFPTTQLRLSDNAVCWDTGAGKREGQDSQNPCSQEPVVRDKDQLTSAHAGAQGWGRACIGG